MRHALGSWPVQRWLVAFGAAAALVLVIAVPTDLLDTPWFSRDIPPTAWAWPALLASCLLSGMLLATYVVGESPDADQRPARGGWAGSLLTYLAVGCPVCNKLVVLALGSAGAMSWFAPLQPILQVGALALLTWALHRRLTTTTACPTTPKETHV